MEHTGLKYEFIAGWEVDRNGRPIKDRGGLTLEKVKQSIDAGKPIIVQAKGHFYLIKGYTETGEVVVNDSWTDRSVGVSYSLRGNNAIYGVNNSPYTVIKAAEYYL